MEVLVVDRSSKVRRALRAVLEVDGNVAVVGEAETACGAVEEARRLRPHVVVTDLRLADGSGIDACRAILAEAPEVRVLILSAYEDEHARRESLAAGAAGYLLKDLDPSWLREAIHCLPTDSPISPQGSVSS